LRRVVVTTTTGRTIVRTRRYRTCRPWDGLPLVSGQVEVGESRGIGDAEFASRALRKAARVYARDARSVRASQDVEGRSGLGVSDQLAVELDGDRRARGEDLDAQMLAVGKDDCPVEEAVRRVRGDDHALRARGNERSACRERVGGGALRRGHDDAVAGVPYEQLAIDAQAERRLAAAGNAAEDDIVVGDLRRQAGVLGGEKRESGASLNGVATVAQRGQRAA